MGFGFVPGRTDPYAGLSKVNTPLQTPLRLSLEEWGTGPSRERYELFAAVMHSGVTISSGHYTAFIKMMDLKEAQPPQGEDDAREEARPCGPRQEYDDGEASFDLGPKPHVAAPGKAGGKKGLLGGQRSVSGFELGGSKPANQEKGPSAAANGARSERTGSAGDEGAGQESGNTRVEGAGQESGNAGDEGVGQESGNAGRESGNARDEGAGQESGNAVQESRNARDEGADPGKEGRVASEEAAPSLAPGSLLDYEGKWMLFDDSEVRLFDEKDFLTACSPETCTTSTPYLLFYKKVCQE